MSGFRQSATTGCACFSNMTAADIFEYQWPVEKDAEYYILQEQISIYLDIKSFKRKYPGNLAKHIN